MAENFAPNLERSGNFDTRVKIENPPSESGLSTGGVSLEFMPQN